MLELDLPETDQAFSEHTTGIVKVFLVVHQITKIWKSFQWVKVDSLENQIYCTWLSKGSI